jgi:hypothetical protein
MKTLVPMKVTVKQDAVLRAQYEAERDQLPKGRSSFRAWLRDVVCASYIEATGGVWPEIPDTYRHGDPARWRQTSETE